MFTGPWSRIKGVWGGAWASTPLQLGVSLHASGPCLQHPEHEQRWQQWLKDIMEVFSLCPPWKAYLWLRAPAVKGNQFKDGLKWEVVVLPLPAASVRPAIAGFIRNN